MSYKSLIVHVEASELGRERLRAAIELGRMFGARIIGVGARSREAMPDPIGLSVRHLREVIETDLANAERVFKSDVASSGVPVVWRSHMEAPTQALLRNASAADLIVAGSGVEAQPTETKAGTADLIMGAGAPVLMIPSGARMDFRQILIGWKNTREARRAVWDAMPLLERAERVHVLRFASDEAETVSGIADVAERLRLHGVSTTAQVRARNAAPVAEQLLEDAGSLGAGLIVVGGYGHSRLREWVLGGVTQHLLQHGSICTLFSR